MRPRAVAALAVAQGRSNLSNDAPGVMNCENASYLMTLNYVITVKCNKLLTFNCAFKT